MKLGELQKGWLMMPVSFTTLYPSTRSSQLTGPPQRLPLGSTSAPVSPRQLAFEPPAQGAGELF